MPRCKITPMVVATEITEMRIYIMRMTIRTIRMIIVPVINMSPINAVCPATVRMPPCRIIPPIKRRIPYSPCRSPEPIINHGRGNIHRLYNIIRTIYVFVTNDLHNSFIRRRVALYIYARYILKYILGKNSLYHNEMLVPVSCFYNSQIINLTVTVKIQI